MLKKVTGVIDAHCHLASMKANPEDFFIGIARGMAVKAAASGQNISENSFKKILLSQQCDDYGDALVKQHREAGINHAVLLAPDFSYAFGRVAKYKEVLEHHIEVCKRHKGHFILFAGIDPRWGDDGYHYFESLLKRGLCHGLKLYPPCGYSMSAKECFPLYELCKKYSVPVLYHSGPTSPSLSFKFCDPFDIDDAAMMFPEVNFIAAHGAVNLWQSFVLLAKYRPNVYLDISGFPSSETAGNGSWKSHLKRVFSCGINHKLIFGSDWPVFRGKGDFKSLLNDVFSTEDGEPLSESESKQITSENIIRVLKGNSWK